VDQGFAFETELHNKRVWQALFKRLLEMTWEEYEELIAQLFAEVGFNVIDMTGRCWHGGTDVARLQHDLIELWETATSQSNPMCVLYCRFADPDGLLRLERWNGWQLVSELSDVTNSGVAGTRLPYPKRNRCAPLSKRSGRLMSLYH
jgi:hypothetical protein